MSLVFFSKLLVLPHPNKNEIVERKHKHILNVARDFYFKLIYLFTLGGSILVVVHLISRCPSILKHNKSPFEILHGFTPTYEAIRTFRCLCFAHNYKIKGDKFACRSRKCIIVGYSFGKKGWKLFDLDTKELFVSRDVKFFEKDFPFKSPEDTNINPSSIFPMDSISIHVDFDDFPTPPISLAPQSLLKSPNNTTHISSQSPLSTVGSKLAPHDPTFSPSKHSASLVGPLATHGLTSSFLDLSPSHDYPPAHLPPHPFQTLSVPPLYPHPNPAPANSSGLFSPLSSHLNPCKHLFPGPTVPPDQAASYISLSVYCVTTLLTL